MSFKSITISIILLPSKMSLQVILNFFLPLAIVLQLSGSAYAQGLKVGFYKATCPNVEDIIQKEMTRIISVAPSLSGALVRLHFHDCFIRGCDASLLLNSTKNNPAEKDAPPNLSLRGYGVIDLIKAKLEKACPETVSCADILALVARDAVYLTKGPSWEVPTGRRDGTKSVLGDFLTNLPAPFFNISQLKASFAQKGLSTKDLVVLSGGHTLGVSHCSSFSSRLYNFSGKGDTDPTLDSEYLIQLKSECKPNDVSTLAEMDPGSSLSFDNGYYKLVSKRRGLFISDAALLDDPETRAYVLRQAKAGPYEFFKDFGVSMVKMGNIEVLTGNQGEIRKNCAFVN